MSDGLTYSNVVTFLKVALPLIALAILATLFLVPRDVDLESAIPFAKVELEKRLRDQQITEPSFSALTPKGHVVSVTASTAHPDAEDASRTIADDLSARITNETGDFITITAQHGEMDATFKELELNDGVRITASAGMQLETDSLSMSVSEVRAESGGPVVAQTGIGNLTAGRMAIRPADETNDVYLFFTNGVRLLYTPQETSKDP